jgi:hypothetical protein
VHAGVRRSGHDCVVAFATQALRVTPDDGKAPENQQPTIRNGSCMDATRFPEFQAKIDSKTSM